MATLPARCSTLPPTTIGWQLISPSEATSSDTPTSPRTPHLKRFADGYLVQPRNACSPGRSGSWASAQTGEAINITKQANQRIPVATATGVPYGATRGCSAVDDKL